MAFPHELKYSFHNLSLTESHLNHDKHSFNQFDYHLEQNWQAKMKNGLFQYTLGKNCLPTKVLPGMFKYIVQLNTDRAEKRRKPQEFQSINQPFNPAQFNFNKVKEEELIMKLSPAWLDNGKSEENLLLINVSPLEYCHVLLVPFRDKNRPQRVTREGLRLSLEVLMLSKSPNFRVGFNSICGFASVKHEHWHAYYLAHRLYLVTAPLQPIVDGDDCKKKCFQLEDKEFPPGFCFVLDQLQGERGMTGFLDTVMELVKYLQETGVAHNVFMTRGSTLNKEGHFDSVRVFLWARTSSTGAKVCDAFNPALCELGGHFPIKSKNQILKKYDESAYDTITEEFILAELHAICDTPFETTKQWASRKFCS